jgi:hypothetical protein
VSGASDIIRLSADLAGDLRPDLEDAIAAVHAVHPFPNDAPAIAVEADSTLLTEARYTPEVIRIHPVRPRRRIALLHEVGHFIDDQVLVPGARATGSPELESWRRAALRSDAILELREMWRAPSSGLAVAHIEYLLRFTETFARSYVQWIGMRSGHDSVLSEIGAAQEAMDYREFWAFSDFEEIAAEMDVILASA